MNELGWLVIKGVLVIVGVLLSVGYLTLVERKVLGYMQGRKGPNIVGIYGLLQPIADGVKLLFKEIVIPQQASKGLYAGSAVMALSLAIGGWGVIPFGSGEIMGDIEIGVLYILAISSMGVYSVLMAGWASNNRYSYIGAIRAVAQMVSYELVIGIIVIVVVICAGSWNIGEIVEGQRVYYIVGLLPIGVMYYISILAETGRVPFDLTEAESELISGYNVEYSGMGFGLFFIAEYANIIIMGALGVIMFMGGWCCIGVKIGIVLLWVIWVRGSLPRVRYDQLMGMLWKSYIIGALGGVIIVAGILKGCGGLPGI